MHDAVVLGDPLEADGRRRIYFMLNDARTALSRNKLDIGKVNVVPHRIELTNNKPLWQGPRQFPTPIKANYYQVTL